MTDGPLERMEARARAVRARATVRRWEYRQRNHAAGAWFHLRRVLADAKAAYAVSDEEASQLVADGYRPEACGRELSPEKLILFVDEARLPSLQSRRAIPLALGPDLLTATAVILLAFDETRTATGRTAPPPGDS